VSTQSPESAVVVYRFDDHSPVRTVSDPDGTFSVVALDYCRAKGIADSLPDRKLPYPLRQYRVIPTSGGFQRVCVVYEEGFRKLLQAIPRDCASRERASRVDAWAERVLIPLFRTAEADSRPHHLASLPVFSEAPRFSCAEVKDFYGCPIRTFRDPSGFTWYIGVDVCRALDIVNPNQALARLDLTCKTLISDEGRTDGGSRQHVAIDEGGLAKLLMSSRVEKAEPFRNWLANEFVSLRRAVHSPVSPSSPPLPPSIDLLKTSLQAALATIEHTERLSLDVRSVRDDQRQLGRSIDAVEVRASQAEAKATDAEVRAAEAEARAVEAEARALQAEQEAERAKREANRAVRTVTSEADCFCLVTWAETKGIKLIPPQDAKEGKIATYISRLRGYEPEKLRTPRFPDGVNIYPESVLEEWLGSYRRRQETRRQAQFNGN
jgi:hypothetical protein